MPSRLPIRPPRERHHLAEADLQPIALDTEGLDTRLEAGHLAVVVGSPHVDHPVEPADQELVPVVREVAGQVGVVAALIG